MFVVIVHYLDRDRIERARPAHLAWIREHTTSGTMLFTGRQLEPESGIMIAQANSAAAFGAILAADPYAQCGAASHDVVAFDPRGGSLLSSLRSS